MSDDEVRGRRDDMFDERWGRRNRDGGDREDVLNNGLGEVDDERKVDRVLTRWWPTEAEG